MIKFWKFLSGSIVAAVCLGLMLVPAGVALASDNVTIGVQPATTTVGFGEAFSITVEVDNPDAVPISTVAARLDFDTTYFNVTSITDGPTLTTILLNQYNNANGTIDYDAGILGGNTTSTTILVCTINCLSKGVDGVSKVDLVYTGGPPPRETAVHYGSTDYLERGNTSLMNSGMVIVGVPPAITVSPDSLAFNAIEGGENPPDQKLELCNWGSGTMDWSLTDNAAWLSETPTGGNLGEGGCEDVTVSVDVTGMEAGDYSATITITGSGEVLVPVSLHIESETVPIPGGPADLSASALSISPQQVQSGQEVTISINIANSGGETGSYNAVLYINSAVEDSQSVSVPAGTSKNVIFTVSKAKAGVYDVSLAGQSGQFEVVGGGGWAGGGGLGTGGIIAIVVVVIILIVVLAFIIRGRRREV